MEDKELKPEKIFETIRIEPKLSQMNDMITEIVENWTAVYVENWNNYCEEQLYKLFQKYEISKVFVISEKDFKRFLLWALPKWYELIEEEENENKRRD